MVKASWSWIKKSMPRRTFLLSPTPFEGIDNLPMIEFHVVATSLKLHQRDTIIFTSKQAVQSAYTIDQNIIHYPAITIGSATQKAFESLGGTVLYSAKKFYGEELASDIKKDFCHKRLLYLRPKKVSTDIKALLSDTQIDISEQIIYETSCKFYNQRAKPPKDSIIIFTSPSTIRCFLKNFEWDSSYIAIVIGEATLKHLPSNATYHIAHTPLLEACVYKAFEIA
jgi:uroporphyrinogen-III synthase